MTVPVTGHTTVAGIIGEPVAHSRSPAIHNAAFEAQRLDWIYVAFPVRPGQVRTALEGLRALGIAGCNVTMPHKREAALACDHLEPTAAALGVVNTVCIRGERLVGDSTDGAGFVDAAREAGIDVDASRILVLGAGGAARSIVHAVRDAAALRVWARRPEAAANLTGLADRATVVPTDELAHAVTTSDLVVNATPLGMHGEPPPFDGERLHAGQTVIDAVYAPPETSLLAAAREHGAVAINGLGMLVHQAARSFTLFTGCAAPLETMWAAARDAP